MPRPAGLAAAPGSGVLQPAAGRLRGQTALHGWQRAPTSEALAELLWPAWLRCAM